jgi:hypothetical protein
MGFLTGTRSAMPQMGFLTGTRSAMPTYVTLVMDTTGRLHRLHLFTHPLRLPPVFAVEVNLNPA